MVPLNINLGDANPGTINLGPTCITDWQGGTRSGGPGGVRAHQGVPPNHARTTQGTPSRGPERDGRYRACARLRWTYSLNG